MDFAATNTFREAKEEIRRALRPQVQALRPDCPDLTRLSVSVDLSRFSTFSSDRTYRLKLRALIGGIKGWEIHVRRLQIWGSSYRAEVVLTVIDHFGVDQDDLYQDGLIAMWILQHQRHATPFVNRVQIGATLEGTL